jgi:hypothetical protein
LVDTLIEIAGVAIYGWAMASMGFWGGRSEPGDGGSGDPEPGAAAGWWLAAKAAPAIPRGGPFAEEVVGAREALEVLALEFERRGVFGLPDTEGHERMMHLSSHDPLVGKLAASAMRFRSLYRDRLLRLDREASTAADRTSKISDDKRDRVEGLLASMSVIYETTTWHRRRRRQRDWLARGAGVALGVVFIGALLTVMGTWALIAWWKVLLIVVGCAALTLWVTRPGPVLG